jgi:hypothetical protein
VASVLSAGSVASVLSAGSVASILSAGSVGRVGAEGAHGSAHARPGSTALAATGAVLAGLALVALAR